MNHRMFVTAAAACWLAASPCLSQVRASSEDISRDLRSTDWVKRYTAFGSLKKQSGWLNGSQSDVLVQLLRREDEFIAATLRDSQGREGVSDKYGEGYGEYYSDLFEICLRYCEKDSLLRLLLHNARSGSPVQRDAVDLLGVVRNRGFTPAHWIRIDSALVAAVTNQHSFMVRHAGVVALANILHQDRGLLTQARTAMHDAIVTAAADAYGLVRLEAVRTLAYAGDPKDLSLLESIAIRDTMHSVRNGRTTFPVREEAARSINKIRSRR